ncbi:MAG: hypothetical protein LC789_18325 [Actinobacteria bacterium]|nr:hypothetical protein [Actinomycetota bacterium]
MTAEEVVVALGQPASRSASTCPYCVGARRAMVTLDGAGLVTRVRT